MLYNLFTSMVCTLFLKQSYELFMCSINCSFQYCPNDDFMNDKIIFLTEFCGLEVVNFIKI